MPTTAFNLRAYELTCLVPTSYSESEAVKIQEQVVALITKHKGSATSKENWGKRKMAYTIKHGGSQQKDAFYLHFQFEMPSLNAVAFERDVYLLTQVMRHLLVVAEAAKGGKADKAVPAAKSEAKAE